MSTTMTEPPPQAAMNVPRDTMTSTNSASNAPGRGQRRRRGGRGGRGGRVGSRVRGGEHQQPDSQQTSQEANGQSSSANIVNGDAANKRVNNNNRTRRPRSGRRGRGGGRGDDAIGGSNSNAAMNGAVIESNESPPSPRTQQAMAFIADSLAGSNIGAANGDGNAATNGKPRQENQPKKQRNKKKGKKQVNSQSNTETNPNITQGDAAPSSSQQQQTDAEKKKKKRTQKNRNRKKNTNPKYAWREFVPQGLEDPISLQPLVDLMYPPFAVVVQPPYVPVLPGMWPPPPLPTEDTLPSSSDGGDDTNVEETKAPSISATNDKDRELAILKEQWGDGVAVHSKESNQTNNTNNPPPPNTATSSSSNNTLQNRHFNLFDGRVLAYYLVSTLQFIDPLNRRDLTRPELQALDAYLSHHRLGNAGVVEAYDAKGVTVSTAGSAAQSASGRAEILQQEARAILSSFWTGAGGGASLSQPQTQSRLSREQQQQPTRQQQRERRDARRVHSLGDLTEEQEQEEMNSFQRMYAAQGGRGSGAQNRGSRNGPQSSYGPAVHDTGIYEGDGGGLLVIDDDINPGLRSGIPVSSNHDDATTGSTFYSAREIAERHSQEAQAREGNFPSLSTATVAASSTTNVSKKTLLPPSAASSKSLSKISKLVKKTDAKEVQRQIKAREEAQRRAELSKLSFFNPDAAGGSMMANNGMMATTTASTTMKMPPSEAVMERNRNLAMALGVAPSTIRNTETTLTTGWARPVASSASALSNNEFGNELLDNAAHYPDSLLSEAKEERMTELLKLEKQLKKFLSDDRAASYSLKAMDRPLRKFVHEYSDFWKLRTESYDPEGRRYVHCSKLVDTSAPYPLLSDAVRRWRGPNTSTATFGEGAMMTLPTGPALKLSSAPSSSSTWQRTEQRVPLKLVPRSVADGNGVVSLPDGPGMTHSTSTPLLSMTGERPPPPRFADLGQDKERTRLQLAPRSIPTWDELEKRHITQEEWNTMTPDRQEGLLREIEDEEDRKKAFQEREKEKEGMRVYKMENRARKKRDLMKKKRAILESAFASSDEDGDGGSSGSDWFEGDLEFDGSDDEGM
mmetsp:Transcript_16940/g.27539  ORF Transcript_16940/g.27539 Transcript_16940/m.27539 type:complete len:1080 (-) Transcript_16940:164-3403(-)